MVFCAGALLKLLAAPAGAGIVRADLLALAHRLGGIGAVGDVYKRQLILRQIDPFVIDRFSGTDRFLQQGGNRCV